MSTRLSKVADPPQPVVRDPRRTAAANGDLDRGVVYMVADWTNQDAMIAALLERHGRTGIPLYLMYPADSSQSPMILPQLLTKSMVLEALDAVSADNPDVVASF